MSTGAHPLEESWDAPRSIQDLFARYRRAGDSTVVDAAVPAPAGDPLPQDAPAVASSPRAGAYRSSGPVTRQRRGALAVLSPSRAEDCGTLGPAACQRDTGGSGRGPAGHKRSGSGTVTEPDSKRR